MGNRAVIVTEDTTYANSDKKIGLYVHWYGDKDVVQSVLDECKEKGVRNFRNDELYFWARFCQIFADRLSKDSLESEYEIAKKDAYSTGIGIGIVNQLDCYNGDNGVYYINKDFQIVKHTSGKELEEKVEAEDE